MVECEGLAFMTLAIIEKWSRKLRGASKGREKYCSPICIEAK
jgi:hypothetical protein